MTTMYELAREAYAKQGIDTEAVIETLANKAISMHCWQGDDVVGFDQGDDNAASGGIMTTGNYPGRAATPEQLMADFEKAASLIPGKKRINLHASYAIFTEENPWVDRDKLEYKHFEPWVTWAKKNGFGIDFNPTLFSHPLVKEGLTVSSPEKEVRDFWIRHCIACRQIAERIGEEMDDMVLNNFWIPDGLKDYAADAYGLRARLKDSLDEIYSFETPHVIDAVEQKVFGIGVEGFTTGNQEFYVSYAAKKGGNHVVLIDAGHFNPMESISDKLPSLLQFFPYVPLHVTRSMHWDSDHVVLFEDSIKDIAAEVVQLPRGHGQGPYRHGLLRCFHQPHRRLGYRHARHGKVPAVRTAAALGSPEGAAGYLPVLREDDRYRAVQDHALDRGLGRVLRTSGRSCRRPAMERG